MPGQAGKPERAKRIRDLSTTIDITELSGNARRHRRESFVKGLFVSAAVASIVISALIVFSLIGRAAAWMTTIDPGDLFAGGWFPRAGEFNILVIIAGTLVITIIAMLVATPLGLGAAIYL